MPLYTDMLSLTSSNIDASAINNSIRNILLTREGSVPGMPTFGSNLSDTIFNLMDHITKDLLEKQISEALSRWEPRILLQLVEIKEMPEYNKMVVSIKYKYRDKGLNVNEQLSVAFTQ